jgi:hypothetical protein
MKIDNIKTALKARVAALNLNPAVVTVPRVPEKTANPIEQEKPPVASQFDNVVSGTKAKATTKSSVKISSPQIQLIPAQISVNSGEKVTPPATSELSRTPTDKPTRKPATRKQNPATDIPLENIEAIVAKHLKAGRDYDRLPNTIKPTLLKSGAEILADVFGFRTSAKVINRIADYEKQFVLYEVCVTVVNSDGKILADGLGSCNSRERKYLKTDFASNLNTVLKIAKKRAFVDGILTATHASKVFTQDMEDIVNLQIVADNHVEHIK